MSTDALTADHLDSTDCSDTEAVLTHAFDGTQLDPEVVRRVDERAARITDRIHRTHGVIDDETFQTLLDDES